MFQLQKSWGRDIEDLRNMLSGDGMDGLITIFFILLDTICLLLFSLKFLYCIVLFFLLKCIRQPLQTAVGKSAFPC